MEKELELLMQSLLEGGRPIGRSVREREKRLAGAPTPKPTLLQHSVTLARGAIEDIAEEGPGSIMRNILGAGAALLEGAPAIGEMLLEAAPAGRELVDIANKIGLSKHIRGPTDDLTASLAGSINRFAEEEFPLSEDPSFLGTEVFGALGSMAPIVAASLIHPAAGLAIATTQGAGGARARTREAGLEGTPEGEARIKVGAAIGASEMVPIANFLRRADALTGGAAKRFVTQLALQSGEEGLQEFFSSLASSGADVALLDSDITIMEAFEEAGRGALVGVVAGGLTGGGLSLAVDSRSMARDLGDFIGERQKANKEATEDVATSGIRFPEWRKERAKESNIELATPSVLDTPEIEASFQESKGIGTPGFKEKLVKAVEFTKRQVRPNFAPLLSRRKDAVLIDELRIFKESPAVSRIQAFLRIDDNIEGFTEVQLDTYTKVLATRDIQRDLDAGLYEGRSEAMPFYGKGEDPVGSLALDRAKLESDMDPIVAEAVERRTNTNREIVQRMVSSTLLPAETLQNVDSYYHRQVLSHVSKEARSSSSRRDIRNRKQGFQRRRIGGSEFNTNYQEAEFEWMAGAFHQLQTVQTLERINSYSNIAPSIRRELRTRQEVQAVGGIAASQRIASLRQSLKEGNLSKEERVLARAELNNIDTLAPFKQKKAIALESIKRMINKGDLKIPPHLQSDADALLNGDSNARFGALLNYVSDLNTEQSIPARSFFKAIAEQRDFIKAKLGRDYVDPDGRLPDSALPEGHVNWFPEESNIFFPMFGISEQAMTAAIEAGVEIDPSTLRKVLVRGPERGGWVVPKEVAETLDNLGSSAVDSELLKLSSALTTTWKKWTLTNPYRVVKYNINNISGDLDILLAIRPQAAKGALKAAKDAYTWQFGKASGDLRTELEMWTQFAGIDSGFRAVEVSGSSNAVFVKRLQVTDNKAVSRAKALSRKLSPAGLTQWRENILRLAMARDTLAELEAGKRPIYASNFSEMEQLYEAMDNGLKSKEEIAAKLSREAIGDYGNISTAGQHLRKHIIPFWSWMEINTPRYARLVRNLTHEESNRDAAKGFARVGAVTAKRIAIRGGSLALRANILFAAKELWNRTIAPGLYDIDDDELDRFNKQRKGEHLILGRMEDGSIRSLRFQGALQDAADWFGMGNVIGEVGELSSGEKSYTQFAQEALLGNVDKLVNGLRPVEKSLYEAFTGVKTFPSTFTVTPSGIERRNNTVRDPLQHIASTWSVKDLYDRIFTNVPTRTPTDFAESLFSYRTNPDETAYWTSKQLAVEWQNRMGVEIPRTSPTKRSNALYYYRKSLEVGQDKRAAEWFFEYKSLGGTVEGLKKSIDMQHPLRHVPDKQLPYFLLTLDSNEANAVRQGMAHYINTFKDGEIDKRTLRIVRVLNTIEAARGE